MAVRTLLRRLRDQRGFTLPELLIVSAGLIVILGAILGLADVAHKIAPQERERVHAMRDAEVGLAKMTRELRQAHSLTINSGGRRASAQILKGGAVVTVVYDCSAAPVEGLRTCLRTQTGGAGAGTQTAIERVANANDRPIFTVSQRDNRTNYLRAVIEVPARGERSTGAKSRVVLEDGAYLRNVDVLG